MSYYLNTPSGFSLVISDGKNTKIMTWTIWVIEADLSDSIVGTQL